MALFIAYKEVEQKWFFMHINKFSCVYVSTTYPKISKETDTKPPASVAINNNNYYYKDIKIIEAISANLSTYSLIPLSQSWEKIIREHLQEGSTEVNLCSSVDHQCQALISLF